MHTVEVNARKQPPREDSSERRLALGVVVALVLLGGGLIGLISLMSLNWMLRSEPFWSLPTPPTQRGRPQPLEIVKVALTIVAGVGGLVALTVAYRRQVWLEADTAGQRERRKALHDRYGAAVAQLGHENPNVRLAGVYALANLADEWDAQRQQCVDVLCAYLRVPWDSEPAEDHPLARKSIESPGPRRTTTTYTYTHSLGEDEVRRTIIRVIAAHLRASGLSATYLPGPWSSLALDFTGAMLPEADFSKCTFGGVRFSDAHFQHSAWFKGATFADNAWFDRATFSDNVRFEWATFADDAWFEGATFSDNAGFDRATFSGHAWFAGATFAGDAAFRRATFSGDAGFEGATFSGHARFEEARFFADAWFKGATFSTGTAPRELRRFLDESLHLTDADANSTEGTVQ